MVYGYAEALYDDDDVYVAEIHEEVGWVEEDAWVADIKEMGWAEEDAQVVDSEEVAVDAWAAVMAEDVGDLPAVPVERRRAHHTHGQVLIEGHFPDPRGFLEQRERYQLVGFPAPLELVQVFASGSALTPFLVTANPEVLFRPRHSYDQ